MNVSKPSISKVGVVSALVYPVLFLLLYFSLAWHLHSALGGWPDRIGLNPGTTAFRIHDSAAALFFWLGTLLVPVSALAAFLFSFFPGYRRAALYYAIFAFAGFVAWAAMHLAPTPFLIWWWD